MYSPTLRRAQVLLAAVPLAFLPLPALFAADGDLLAWKTLFFDLGGTKADSAAAIAVRPDGKVLQFGTVVTGLDTHRMALAQYLADGSPDPGFGTGGKLVDPFGINMNSWGNALVLLPNGVMFVGATVDLGGGDHNFLVGKLDGAGVPWETFGVSGEGYTTESVSSGGDSTDDLAAIAVDGQGRIVMVGTSDGGPTDLEIGVARLVSNGIWDDGFSGNGNRLIGLAALGGPDHGLAVAIDRNDRIVIAGATWDSGTGSDYDVAILALEPDGDLDPTFDGDGIVKFSYDLGGNKSDYPRALAIWPDGEIVVSGNAATGTDRSAWFVRSVSASGGTLHDGTGTFCGTLAEPCTNGPRDSATALLLQGDGKVVLGGTTSGPGGTLDFGAARLDRSLAPDDSFSGDGKTTFDFSEFGSGANEDDGTALAFDRDGRIVLGGTVEYVAPDFDYGWIRLDSSYIFANGFDGPGGTAPWSASVP